jgi:hypothetical protein
MLLDSIGFDADTVALSAAVWAHGSQTQQTPATRLLNVT